MQSWRRRIPNGLSVGSYRVIHHHISLLIAHLSSIGFISFDFERWTIQLGKRTNQNLSFRRKKERRRTRSESSSMFVWRDRGLKRSLKSCIYIPCRLLSCVFPSSKQKFPLSCDWLLLRPNKPQQHYGHRLSECSSLDVRFVGLNVPSGVDAHRAQWRQRSYRSATFLFN
jgi:hypothetical protein